MEGKYSKKMQATLTRERRKIKRNLEGIRHMTKLPGALLIVDVKREHIAAQEARKLNIPVVALLDTDSDPDAVDIPIPGNDDAMRAIELICNELGNAIMEGKRSRAEEDKSEAPAQQAQGRGHRRSARATARSEEEAPSADREPAAGESVGDAAPGSAVASA
jgi:small subunit ribosomal protein S2